MKNTFLTLLILTLFFTNCTKDVNVYFPGPMFFGEAAAKKNGVDWEASGAGFYHDNSKQLFGLQIGTVSENNFLREIVSFNEIPTKIGKYDISGSGSNIEDDLVGADYFTLQDDGDVQEDSYQLNEGNFNKIEVTSIDTIANIVKGTFSVKFEIDPDREKVNPNNPDKVKFKNGTFDVQLVQ